MTRTFLTSDGYRLWLVGAAWFDAPNPDDADLSFDDLDGRPLGTDGFPLDGHAHCYFCDGTLQGVPLACVNTTCPEFGK